MNFKEYIQGKTFRFYGVCNNEFKLDESVWEAIEDESDGYRSYLESIEKKDSDGIFLSIPIAIIKIVEIEVGDFQGFKFIDITDNHVWLSIGTDHTDSYYPYFVFNYKPKEGNSDMLKNLTDEQNNLYKTIDELVIIKNEIMSNKLQIEKLKQDKDEINKQLNQLEEKEKQLDSKLKELLLTINKSVN